MMPSTRNVVLTFVVACGILFAGCAQPAPEEPDGSSIERPATSAEDAPVVVGEPGAAPVWKAGDWWSWDLKSRDAGLYQVTTVVASTTDTEYSLGWTDTWGGLAAQFFHFLPNGDVNRADLSFEAHQEPVTLFHFPLQEGSTWTGGTWLADMAFVSHETDVITPGIGSEKGFRIHGESDDGGVVFDILWSSSAKTFTNLVFYLYDETPWLVLELTDFGSDHHEPVNVLHRDGFVMRFASVPAAVEARSAPPVVEAVTIPDGATHYSMGCYVGGAPGRYEAAFWNDAASRNGCLVENVGTSDEPLGIAWGELTGGGEWRLELTTLGQGQVFVELFLIRLEAATPTG